MAGKPRQLTDPLCRAHVSSTHSATPSRGLFVGPELSQEQPHPPPTTPELPDPGRFDLIDPEWLSDRHRAPTADEFATTFRHSFWAAARERVRRALVDAGVPLARRFNFQECGANPLVQVCPDTGRVRITSHNCHDRWCRACGRIRRQRLASALAQGIRRGRCMAIVLTPLSNDQPLSQQLTHLLESFAKLRRRRWWRQRVRGGAWVFECTWNADTRQWHPHLHCLVQGKWIQLQELSAKWHQCTGDSHRVHISLVRNAPSAIAELTKYVGKITHRTWEHDHDLLVHAMKELAGRRLCNAFGSWKDLELLPTSIDLSPATWITWGSVNAMLRLAEAGDPDAKELLAALREGRPVQVPQQKDSKKSRPGDYPEAGRAPPICAPLSA